MPKDPAFLFYPADASEDTQVMNRLERGAYFDILKAQKRFGRFTLEQLKKVLGSDFDIVWPAIKMCLSCVEDMYFITWVDESIEKRKEYSESRRNNRKKSKSSEKPFMSSSHDDHMNNISGSYAEHMVNAIENVNTNEVEEGGMGETDPETLLPTMLKQFTDQNQQYPVDQMLDLPSMRLIAEKILKWLSLPGQITDEANRDAITRRWGDMIAYVKADQHLSGYSITQINKYFQTIAQGLFSKYGKDNSRFTGGKPIPEIKHAGGFGQL